ncbi:manganase accumulation protein MntS [Klebsiella sp. BIGb0407]|nr:manganase accumulation protein MntS [Klebsiella sp. BIGb0407]MCS3430861.1 hypothetical protein [Klebsiella sp. BIGb0407]
MNTLKRHLSMFINSPFQNRLMLLTAICNYLSNKNVRQQDEEKA